MFVLCMASECPEGMYRSPQDSQCLRCPARATTNGTAKGSLKDCACELGYHGDPGAGVACAGEGGKDPSLSFLV